MQKLNEYFNLILVKNRVRTVYALLFLLLMIIMYDRCSTFRKNDINYIVANSVRFDLPEILKNGKGHQKY